MRIPGRSAEPSIFFLRKKNYCFFSPFPRPLPQSPSSVPFSVHFFVPQSLSSTPSSVPFLSPFPQSLSSVPFLGPFLSPFPQSLPRPLPQFLSSVASSAPSSVPFFVPQSPSPFLSPFPRLKYAKFKKGNLKRNFFSEKKSRSDPNA